jgi:hypothetical protein
LGITPARRPAAQPPLFFPWPPFLFPFFFLFSTDFSCAGPPDFLPRAAQLGSSPPPPRTSPFLGRSPTAHSTRALFFFWSGLAPPSWRGSQGCWLEPCAQRTAARRGAMAQPPCNPAAVSPTFARVSRAHIGRITHDTLVQETGLLSLPCSTQSLSLARHRTGRKPNHRLELPGDLAGDRLGKAPIILSPSLP